MRLVTIEDEATVDIKSIPTPDFQWDTNGRSCKKYLEDMFDSMILNLLNDMKTNPKVVLKKFGADNAKALYPVVKVVGKIFSVATVGNACKLMFIKCSPEIENMLIKIMWRSLLEVSLLVTRPLKRVRPKVMSLWLFSKNTSDSPKDKCKRYQRKSRRSLRCS